MSFSNDVKLELAHVVVEKPCCQRTLLAGILLSHGHIVEGEGLPAVVLDITNAAGVRLVLRLARLCGNPSVTWEARRGTRFREETRYRIKLSSLPALAFLEAVGITRCAEPAHLGEGDVQRGALSPMALLVPSPATRAGGADGAASSRVAGRAGDTWRGYELAEVRKRCCKRAFVRGAFLAGGSVGHPQRYYHLEWISRNRLFEDVLMTLLHELELPVNALARKHHVAFYLKGASDIARALTLMGATMSLLYLEEVRAVKETKNLVHRRVNCETANLERTSQAAVRQVSDIRLIKEKLGFQRLSDDLRKVARLRLRYPDASYSELGKRLVPPATKVAVSRALQRLEKIAHGLEQGPPRAEADPGDELADDDFDDDEVDDLDSLKDLERGFAQPLEG